MYSGKIAVPPGGGGIVETITKDIRRRKQGELRQFLANLAN
jgi:hypothetical protein